MWELNYGYNVTSLKSPVTKYDSLETYIKTNIVGAPYEGVHLVLIWHHRPPLVSQPWQRSASCTSPFVFHLILGLRPQIIVFRLDEGNQQQIYRGHVYTTPLMVGDGR